MVAIVRRMSRLVRRVKNERGASMIEYGLLLALITLIAIVAFQVLGQNTSTKLSTATSMFG